MPGLGHIPVLDFFSHPIVVLLLLQFQTEKGNNSRRVLLASPPLLLERIGKWSIQLLLLEKHLLKTRQFFQILNFLMAEREQRLTSAPCDFRSLRAHLSVS